MSLFSENIKHLRIKRDLSQREVGEALLITRDRYAKYEDGVNSPPAEILLSLSRFFHISIDLLLSVDIRKIDMDQLLKLDDNRILLPITVDRQGENFIEIVPHKARAGYLTGYADPEFIEGLQQLSLPFLGAGKFRAFPVGGDSMPPHNELSFVVGRYVENLGDIKKNKTYILVTLSEGITYKRLYDKNSNGLMVAPDNIKYNPYEIKLSDILEIWEYVAHIGRDDSKPQVPEMANIDSMFRNLQNEIRAIGHQKG